MSGVDVVVALSIVAAIGCGLIAGAGPLVVGAALYLVGTILVTGIFNVPMNERLAAIDAGGPAAETEWETYFRRWVVWNHVRTAAAVVASAAMVAGVL